MGFIILCNECLIGKKSQKWDTVFLIFNTIEYAKLLSA